MKWEWCNQCGTRTRSIRIKPWMARSRFEAPTIPFNRGALRQMGAFTMGFPRLLLVTAIVGFCRTAWAQSPTYGVGRTPTAEEIRAWDIAISPTGKELPTG